MIKYFRALLSIKSQRIACLITSLIWQAVSSGQQLELFEETETGNRVEETSRADRARRDSDGNIVSGPEFVLVGTTRIGGNFLVVLEDNVKELITVSLPEGSSRSIPGYPGYEVIHVGSSGEASIRYPAGLQCVEFKEQGVTCKTTNEANLSLTNPQPLSLDNLSSSDQSAEQTMEESGELVNPFEAILQRSSNPDSDVNSTFSPRRIDPSDVPPGMKVVSTPFGDRLVEEDQ